jgi:hypothetical protein
LTTIPETSILRREVAKLGLFLTSHSADEHLWDESLTPEQRRWLADFCDRWEASEQQERDGHRLEATARSLVNPQ